MNKIEEYKDKIKVLDTFFEKNLFSNYELDYLIKFENLINFSLGDLWKEMDKVWLEFSLDNTKPFSTQSIDKFYSHPVWILNGIFSSVDIDSQRHRLNIANYISKLNFHNVCDFGGGFGELCLNISKYSPFKEIDIIEPYPSKVLQSRIRGSKNINLKSNINKKYDVIVAQDVLEHLEKPIETAIFLIKSLNLGGQIIFANCFHPFILAHLPKNFHLSRSFAWIIQSAGIKYLNSFEDAQHILIFEKKSNYINYPLLYSKFFISLIYWRIRSNFSFLK